MSRAAKGGERRNGATGSRRGYGFRMYDRVCDECLFVIWRFSHACLVTADFIEHMMPRLDFGRGRDALLARD